MTRPPDPETGRLEAASDWLLRLQESAPDAQEIAAWAAWCEADPENLAAFERLLPLWLALDPAQADGRLLDSLRALVEAPASPASPWPRGGMASGTARQPPVRAARRRRLVLAATAACALAVAASVVWWWLPSRPIAEVASVDSCCLRHREVTLPDGSALELGARSAAAVDFQGAQRRIELAEGQAFFTVRHDRARPFVVHAGQVWVTAVGTAFDVLRAGPRVTVTVQEGIVDVADKDGGPPLRAPAGYQVVHDGDGSPVLRAVDVQAATAWRHGRLEYQDEPLASVVASVNRYAATPVVLEEPELGDLRYTGTIEVGVVSEWLHALPRIFPVQVRTESDRAVVVSTRSSRGTGEPRRE